jgi:ATP-dependent DNA ligase
MDRKTGNGLLTKFQKGTGTAALARQVRAVVWDIIPLFAFHKGVCSVGYRERLNMLCLWTTCSGRASVVTGAVVKSMDEAQVLYQQKLLEGEEGLVLKDPAGPWEDKRAKHQVKMKAELEADLYCAGVTPGTGKYQGKIGSLECHSKSGTVVVNVGTGLNDEERSWDPKEFIGKIVSVKYNALIDDKKTGQKSLFLPVFVEIRDDKTRPDSL